MSEVIATRVAYGRELEALGAENPLITVLDADLSICTMTMYFAEKFPERFFNVGIAEANMVGIGAGMAACGLIPFVNSFAMFSAGRAYEQIRNSVAYPRLNVKVVGTHAGLSVGEDGATHQCIEDISLMRTIPGMTVVVPCDATETRLATRALAELEGPAYLRLGRSAVAPAVDDVADYRFELGKASLLREGCDATIIACGLMVQPSLAAANHLAGSGISVRVLDMHTIKPIDRESILMAARETGVILTAEEHNIIGGLGGAVAEVLAESDIACRFRRVGVNDQFGHSGSADDLLEMYGLTDARLIDELKGLLSL
ncbi:transketolase family protein [Actinomyces sp. B33]|uniref:transketolase family protein n=1 Tax=Actinomyces sp. B33 TaxID=2942131 RepID=UPI0023417C66|nr:transketolase family protein [Actinomyces sp. B33]MDC4232505.1 transketolase family protein [Actinomyces sp. B33]